MRQYNRGSQIAAQLAGNAVTPANAGVNMADVVQSFTNSADWAQKYQENKRAYEQNLLKDALTQDYGAAVEAGDKAKQEAILAQLDPAGYAQQQQRQAYLDQQQNNWQQEFDRNNYYKNAMMAIEREKAANSGAGMTDKIRNYEYFADKFGPEKAAEIIKGGQTINVGNMSSNGFGNIFEKKRVEELAKSIDSSINEAQTRMNKYLRAGQILDNGLETGGANAVQAYLPTALMEPNASEFQAIVNEIIPTMRPEGSGSASDKDMEIFSKATIGLDKDTSINKNIIAARATAEENNISYNQLRAEWIANGLSTVDFDREWRKYLNENPIFSNSDGKLNTNRVDAYTYFKNKSSGAENIPTDEDAWGDI